MKRKCRPQNYQCGKICIKGTYICRVDGLSGQSVSIANKLVEVIKISKEKETLNFEGDPTHIRIIDNGRIFVEQNMNIEDIENLIKATDKRQDLISEAEKELFKKYERYEEDILELGDDIELIKKSIQISTIKGEKQELKDTLSIMEENLETLIDEYVDFSNKGVDIPKLLGQGNELENFANLKSKLIANTNKSDISKIKNNFKGYKRWKDEIKEHLTEAYNILGFDKKLNIVNTSPRPHAEDGIDEDILSLYRIKNSKEARKESSEVYNKKQKGLINVGSRNEDPIVNKSKIFHELAHHVEFSNREIAYANRQWIESRRTGPNKTLNELRNTDVYSNSEVAAPDDFITPYVGKIYDNNIENFLVSSEVFSIGFQHFSDNNSMLELYKKDKEHFYLTVGTILEYQNGQKEKM